MNTMAQFLTDKHGKRTFAVLDIATYEALVRAAEDAEDAAIIAAFEANPGELVPHAIVKALDAGTHPLRVWRKHRGFTQGSLAMASSVRQGTISDIEKGKTAGGVATLRALTTALDVTIDDLAPAPA